MRKCGVWSWYWHSCLHTAMVINGRRVVGDCMLNRSLTSLSDDQGFTLLLSSSKTNFTQLLLIKISGWFHILALICREMISFLTTVSPCLAREKSCIRSENLGSYHWVAPTQFVNSKRFLSGPKKLLISIGLFLAVWLCSWSALLFHIPTWKAWTRKSTPSISWDEYRLS